MAVSWADIVREAKELNERFLSEGSLAWYRGHREAKWELKSSIHRHAEKFFSNLNQPLPEREQLGYLRDEYKSIYRKFKIDAWPLMRRAERSDWGVLFTMQHYSIPTRFLDWSESFACAVFFAQLRRKPTDVAAIWVLDPQKLNLAAVGKEGLVSIDENTGEASVIDARDWHPKWVAPTHELPSIAVAPIYSNPRMVSQQSRFTLMGDTFKSLDQQLGARLIQERRLVKIELPPETYNDAEEFLDTAGLTAYTFYPDLYGIALKHEIRVEQEIRSARRFYPEELKDGPNDEIR